MDTCEIRIYDRHFNWLAETHLAESVQFTRELYDTGSFEIHIHPDKGGAFELLQKNNIIIINGDGRKAGVVRDFKIEESRNKQEFVIYGDAADGLTKRFLTVPPNEEQASGSLGWDRFRGSAESAIKHFAAMNMATPYDANRTVEHLIVAPDLGRGIETSWQTRYEKLEETLRNLCTYAEMGYQIYADAKNKQWIFDVIPGVDRTQSQDEVSPIVFRMEYQNIGQYRYAEDRQNYHATGYAGGQGDDEQRLIYILGAENKGIDRWETFIDCGNAADITELIYYGEQRLSEFYEAKNIEVTALPQNFKFDEDYFLGDVVTVVISRIGLAVDTRITSIRETWERSGGHNIEARFGERLPNIFTILDRNGVNR